jgi:hypothetical protein
MNIFKKFWGVDKIPTVEEKQAQYKKLKQELELLEDREEPKIEVIKLSIPDSNKPSQGYFELDWNSSFVDQLIAAGYKGKTDEEIVEEWFNELCKSISDSPDDTE